MPKATTAEAAMSTMRSENVAYCVLAAYGSDRVHWYIPEG
jgi:hypothetical protein